MAHKASWISSSKNVCCGFLKNMCPYYYSDQQKVWRMLYEMNLQR
jgi:5-methylcytosine-specific restriction endonuclease McrBC regulatory subunit McrC